MSVISVIRRAYHSIVVIQRDAFVEQLANHSDAGRFHAQDATFQPPRTKDPEALLSLPEFIREAVPPEAQRLEDPLALLTLPEFVREPPPTRVLEQKEEIEDNKQWRKIAKDHLKWKAVTKSLLDGNAKKLSKAEKLSLKQELGIVD